MLNRLRLMVRTDDNRRESDWHRRTPGHVEVLVEVLKQEEAEGEETWECMLRDEGTPEEARALAEQWMRAAQSLKQAARDAERRQDTYRERAEDSDFFEE